MALVEISLAAAFLGGLISFLSPCIFPIIPGFLAYISGTTIDQVSKGTNSRSVIVLNTIFFVLGFALVFSALGILLTNILADVAFTFRIWASRIGGVIIILFALYLLGIIKLGFLQKEHKFKVKRHKSTYLTSFLFGLAFAVGWTPCVGAVLGIILTLAFIAPGTAFWILLVYSLGLALPFLIAGIFISRFTEFIGKHTLFFKWFNMAGGVFLLLLGILVITGQIGVISQFIVIDEFLVS